MLQFVLIPILSILVLWTWQFLNWVWIRPKKIEKLLRKQGMKGNSYTFLYGDYKETNSLYEKAYSKPIGLHEDIVPRVMPNIHHTVQKYGNYSFSWSGPRPRIYIMDLDVARDVLYNHRKYLKTFRISNHAIRLLVTGLANLEGDEWTKSRTRINHAFNIDKLKPMVPTLYARSEDALNIWKEIVSKNGGSSTIDVFPHLKVFTSSVIAQLMFSSVYTEEIKQTFLQLAELAILARVPSKIFTVIGEKYWPTQTNRRVNEIDRFAKRSFNILIKERLKRGPPSGHHDLLDIFLSELYDGKIRNESERKRIIESAIDECRIFFIGGFETSSNVLTWTMIVLAFHQEWQTRAREEVFQVLGNKKEITSDDISKLKVISMIINEMLRLYPTSMELTRLVDEETKIKDYTVPKGTLLTFPLLMYHRDPKIWGEDVLEFKPDRFADGVLNASNGVAAYMPFGWGPRICIGMNFAMLESKTFLAMLLREFSFELSPMYAHTPIVAFTIQPQFGAPLVLKKL